MRSGLHCAVADNRTFLPCFGEEVFLCLDSGHNALVVKPTE